MLSQAGRTVEVTTTHALENSASLEPFSIVLAVDIPVHGQTASGLVPIVTLTHTEFDELSNAPASFERFIRYAIEKHQNTRRLAGKHLRFELAMRGSQDGLWIGISPRIKCIGRDSGPP